MAGIDIAIVIVGVAFVAVLARAARLLATNPYQQVRAHEDLAGRNFPPGTSTAEKLALIDRTGISPGNPRRVLWLVAVIALILVVLVWVR
jgi:hypothetical protein